MNKTVTETVINYPDVDDPYDIIMCDWEIEGYSSHFIVRGLYCEKDRDMSVKMIIRKAGLVGKVVRRIDIKKIKKIGEKNR